jgi:hypothetical protein
LSEQSFAQYWGTGLESCVRGDKWSNEHGFSIACQKQKKSYFVAFLKLDLSLDFFCKFINHGWNSASGDSGHPKF